eukprot:snap_masked-scaffold_31-processed-gene-3.25-mRNA-1 protein AED:1.00 eAED:1.00 QI:0/-1/0/0/-1/1/1/0/78
MEVDQEVYTSHITVEGFNKREELTPEPSPYWKTLNSSLDKHYRSIPPLDVKRKLRLESILTPNDLSQIDVKDLHTSTH